VRVDADGALRVLILTHFYPPEIGAPQTRLHETARALARRGVAVRVLTGPPHYPTGIVPSGRRWWLPSRESIDGISIIRLPMVPRPNGGLVDRLVDNGSFSAAAVAALPLVRRADVVLVESPPLFLGGSAAVLHTLTRRPYVFHVADPWPDFPIAMGMLQSPLVQRLAFANEWVAYRFASAVTTVTPSLVRRLESKPPAAGKVHLIPNAVDTRRFDPAADPAEIRHRLGWPEARLTVVYVGTVGLAQGLGTAIDAMDRLRGGGIALHVVGGGADRAAVEERVRTSALGDVTLHAPIEAAAVPLVLAAADAVLVMLRRGELYDESLPTKLVEGLAAGRPLIVSAGGEAARIVRDADAGFVAAPEDAESLAAALVAARDSADRGGAGARARATAETDFDRDVVVDRLLAILTDAASAAGRSRDGVDPSATRR
jgi:glycosyltransferase involved in cell wall biosynthesis